MSEQIANNQRIAKNTILLYMRTMLTMVISLYTSRVILQILGVEDYGIYNVVGGFVVLMSFLSGAISSSTSRYITFALGKGDEKYLKDVFSTSLIAHLIIAGVIVQQEQLQSPHNRLTLNNLRQNRNAIRSTVAI